MQLVHYAKMNLSLHITNKRADGYHLLDTVMQEVDVSDTLEMDRAQTLSLTCCDARVPVDASNLVLRAHHKMAERYGIGPVRYHLEKNIPVAAGMGGGSANAAAVLLGLNELFELNLVKETLAEVAITLGADVPYFLYGGTARAQGIGERLTALPKPKPMHVLLINDGTPVSTPEIYAAGPATSRSTIDTLVKELAEGKTRLTVHNDLAPVVYEKYPHLENIELRLRETGADTALLSGSGATFFGIYPDEVTSLAAYELLKNDYDWVRKVLTR